MMVKKYTADSYYEAFTKAQSELGEDVLVVTSRTFSNSSWGGFYSKEMVEITAMAPKPRTAGRPGRVPRTAPEKPMPSEELTFTPVRQNILPTDLRSPIKSVTHDVYPNPPVLPKVEKPVGRMIHTIRSVQLGEEEPRTQRIPVEDDSSAHDERVTKLLEAILSTKKDRQASSGVAPLSLSDPEFRSTKPFQNLEKKISEIFSLLNDMQKTSAGAVAAAPVLLPGLDFIQKSLVATELPAHILDEVMALLDRDFTPAAKKDPWIAQTEFGEWLRKKIRVGGMNYEHPGSGRQTLILLGPTGVGKTTTIAKLAATFALDVVERRSVALLTTDTFRIGAAEQLGRYAQIIEAEFEIILKPDDISGLLEKHKNKDVILVDTAGRCQKQHQELQELQEFVEEFPTPTKFLVLSATTKYSDMLENVRRFGDVGFDHLIFTKVDETNSVGPLLGLLFETSASLAYVTHGQRVPDDFCSADPIFFLNRIFNKDSA